MSINLVYIETYYIFRIFDHIYIAIFIDCFLHIEIFRHPIDKAFLYHL